jgi:hypothetical protein
MQTVCQWLMPVILATQEAGISRSRFKASPMQIVYETLSRKYPTQKSPDGMTQVVEYLPSKCEALRSTPSTAKNSYFSPVSQCNAI